MIKGIDTTIEDSLESKFEGLRTANVAPSFCLKLFLSVLLWALFVLAFLMIIDPYKVSPISISLPGINNFKPRRLNIDRLIKPLEVWRYQPRTVFLGSSRIQQSIDPSILNGTEFAPAYNSAVPAATIDENAALLEEYIRIDKKLKHVFFELFVYAFINPERKVEKKGISKNISDLASLQFSSTALIDSLATIKYNQYTHERPAYIHEQGYWVRPDHWDASLHFVPQTFSTSVLDIEKKMRRLYLNDHAFQVLERLQKLCHEKGVNLTFIITPSYPWDDYRLHSLGYDDFLRDFYLRVSTLDEVYSFAQHDGSVVDESVSSHMKYWSDPLHFSPMLGAMILKSLSNRSDPTYPPNFILRIKPSTVDKAVKIRLDGLQAWLKKSNFSSTFDTAKHLIFKGTPSGSLNIDTKTLTLDNQPYFIHPGVGRIETILKEADGTMISGWAIDSKTNGPVDTIVITSGNKVVAQSLTSRLRLDIEKQYGTRIRPCGFTIQIPTTQDPISAYALRDHIAEQLPLFHET